MVFDINLQTTLLDFSVGVDVSWLVGGVLVGVVVWCWGSFSTFLCVLVLAFSVVFTIPTSVVSAWSGIFTFSHYDPEFHILRSYVIISEWYFWWQ